jgi:hypothetical protein
MLLKSRNRSSCNFVYRVAWAHFNGAHEILSSVIPASQPFKFLKKKLYIPSTYCHVSGVPWLIIMGSRLDLLALLLQLRLITITTAHNDCLRLAPFLTGLRVSSLPLIELVLIYESVTSASVVHWLKLHSWTLVSYEWTDDSSTTESTTCPHFITSEERPPRTVN